MKINKEIYFENLTGYKIPKSHFELGSNLHINDYYYAKRLFYNSFYTNRFAFIVVRYILKEFSVLIKEILSKRENVINSSEDESFYFEKTITLFGYDNYSELLISNVRKMLNDYFSEVNVNESELFNHEIYIKDGSFLKNPSKISKNIISIFPISTTFSTTIKVQNEIRNSLVQKKIFKHNLIFHNPIINCLLISDNDLNEDQIFEKNSNEVHFGWISLNAKDKLIKVKNLDNSNLDIQQKFFVNLKSKWQKINECSLCYPLKDNDKEKEDRKHNNEKCLIETKSSAVTPDLIFSYPKTYPYPNKDIYDLFKIRENGNPIIFRKHFKKYNNNFIYYIKTGTFLKNNKSEIKDWLDVVREKLRVIVDKNIVIVTPSIGSNSGFLNLVNDIMFSDTATVILFNPNEDYIYNFKKFYSEIIKSAHYIIYVDDILFSTNTFNEINFYVKNISRDNGNGIDLCLNLINRVDFYNYQKLINSLPSKSPNDNSLVESYVNVNVPPLLHKSKYPFETLKTKFKLLSTKSVLDEMSSHFLKRKNEFSSIDLVKDSEDLKKFGTPKAFFQFLMFHELKTIFEFDLNENQFKNLELIKDTFNLDIPNAYAKLEEEIKESYNIKSFLNENPKFQNEVKNLIYKIFSSEPFVQFKDIKISVFKWVLNDLVAIVDYISKSDKLPETFFQAKYDEKPTEFSKFQEYKFLLKRGMKLKMNYIYSYDVLMANEKILKGIKEHKTIKKYKLHEKKYDLTKRSKGLFDTELPQKIEIECVIEEEKKIFTNSFITYYVALLQELIIDHESKALETVKNVKKIIDIKKLLILSETNLRDSYNDEFMILLRRMVLENTFIFHSSSEKFIKKINDTCDLLTFEKMQNNESRDAYLKVFKKYFDNEFKKYSFEYTRKMLSRFDSSDSNEDVLDEKIQDSFEYMLMLKSAFYDDFENNNPKSISVQEKVKIILEYCCKILGIENGGAFFAVKYKNRDLHATNADDISVVGEYCTNPNNFIDTNDIDEKSILHKVFDGIYRTDGKYPISCFEMSLDSSNEYQYLKNNQINKSNINECLEVEDKKFGNLFYYRISDIELSKEQIDRINKELESLNDELYDAKCDCNTKKENDLILEIDNLKHKLQIPLPKVVICFYDTINKNIKGKEYDFIRFDPKQVRQLLLLRNDINEFIDDNLNNDSLRAYIEEQKDNKYKYVLNHGMSIYRDTFEINLQNLLEGIQNKGDELIYREKGYLQTVNRYITNKLSLLSNVKEIAEFSEYDINSLIEIFEVNIFDVLFFEHADFYNVSIKEKEFIIFNSDYQNNNGDELLFFPKSFINEVVFELIYNIRKHVVSKNEFSKENPLIITLRIFDYVDKNKFKVSLSNNFAEDNILKNSYLSYSQRGLNLIQITLKKINKNNYINITQKDNIYDIVLSFDNNGK